MVRTLRETIDETSVYCEWFVYKALGENKIHNKVLYTEGLK